ncbi:MAG TPA: ABC transporter substrate-binding protein [Solirubrobacterales bacterium]|nr:ABC transporter substrate-binding protein [Solirubrobacterales bacterium]
MKKLGPVVAVILGALLVLGISSCGDSGSGGKEGGTLKVSYASFPSLDPGRSYTLEGWTAMFETYVPLLTYPRENGSGSAKIIPGLAKDLPEVSNGDKTYTLFLRPGLEYSDGTPVKASDFKATIERLFELSSPGAYYYENIVGAEQFAKTRSGGISGIKTNDKTGEIAIELTSPRGTFANELTLPFAAPLPADTPAKDQTQTPPPATGPYEIADVKPGKGWSYHRNPAWAKSNGEAIAALPAGSMDAIDVTIVRNATTQVNDIEDGRFQWMQNAPPADRYASVKRKFEGTQFRTDPTIANYFFWMNTSKAPFDDQKVREAISYAIDPDALARIYAGQSVVLHQMLPPDLPGSEEFDLFPTDMKKAKSLLAEAKPSDLKIGVWTDDEGPNKEAGEYLDSVLRELGFETDLKVLSADIYYETVGNQSTDDVDMGWASWFSDYPHPNAYFQPLFTAEGISPIETTNLARYDDPALSKKVTELAEVPLGPEQEAAYAELNKQYGEAAAYVPYGAATISTFVSSDIDLDALVVNPTFGQDLTSFRFK